MATKYKICPFCSHKIKPTTTFCIHCGKDLRNIEFIEINNVLVFKEKNCENIPSIEKPEPEPMVSSATSSTEQTHKETIKNNVTASVIEYTSQTTTTTPSPATERKNPFATFPSDNVKQPITEVTEKAEEPIKKEITDNHMDDIKKVIDNKPVQKAFTLNIPPQKVSSTEVYVKTKEHNENKAKLPETAQKTLPAANYIENNNKTENEANNEVSNDNVFSSISPDEIQENNSYEDIRNNGLSEECILPDIESTETEGFTEDIQADTNGESYTKNPDIEEASDTDIENPNNVEYVHSGFAFEHEETSEETLEEERPIEDIFYKDEENIREEPYDARKDGYYEDVLAEVEEEIKHTMADSTKKTILAISLSVITVIVYAFWKGYL